MDETNRNSMKLDIEAARQLSAEKDKEEPKETYKKISESDSAGEGENVKLEVVKNSNMVRENGETCPDGADEKMLNGANGDGDKEKLAQKDVEVKFISDQQNGDAKIDIEAVTEKTFSGMSKEELMKFANDPFWIRLRWILFIFFWALWVAMLVGAVLIIIHAPKCAAPVPLVWWKEGPLVNVDAENYANELADVEKFGAKGIIYELAGDETYFVNTPDVENKIKQLVETFSTKNINVILDLTPNYVTKDDELFKEALVDESRRSPFIWSQTGIEPNNWKTRVGEGSAWKKVVAQNFVLSQYGDDRFDLQMNDPAAKKKFIAVLRHLATLGVKGFRLNNAKHFIVDNELKNEAPSNDNKEADLNGYDFWNHAHTTFQDGLAELFHEYAHEVHNSTEGEGFLSVNEDIVRPEAFKIHDTIMSIDLPLYGAVPRYLDGELNAESAKILLTELTNVYTQIGNSSWIQWPYTAESYNNLPASEYNIFMLLLPGVPVVPLDALKYSNSSHETIHLLEKFRNSPSYMHGTLDLYNDANETVIGYSRIKSGNPGYFVALNPTDAEVDADFSEVKGIAPELTVVLLSDHYKVPDIALKSKIPSNAIKLSPRSAIVLTYVPK